MTLICVGEAAVGIWDLERGVRSGPCSRRPLGQRLPRLDWAIALDFSPDGVRLAALLQRAAAVVWDAETGALICVFGAG